MRLVVLRKLEVVMTVLLAAGALWTNCSFVSQGRRDLRLEIGTATNDVEIYFQEPGTSLRRKNLKTGRSSELENTI